LSQGNATTYVPQQMRIDVNMSAIGDNGIGSTFSDDTRLPGTL